MGLGTLESEVLVDIAEAIRWVGGEEDVYRPSEMAPAIRDLAWGAGEAYGLLMVPEEEGGLYGLWFARALVEPAAGMECRGRAIERVFHGVEDLEYESQAQIPWWKWNGKIGEVRFLNTVRPKRCAMWFGSFYACETFDVAKLDTSLLTDASSMFMGCSAVRALDVSGFDMSQVADVSYMFWQCKKLESLHMGAWDMRGLTNMKSAFYGLNSIEEIDLSEWTIPEQSPDIEDAFGACRELRTIYAPPGCDLGDSERKVYCFTRCEKLVGGNGSSCDGEEYVLSDRAHVDGLDGRPGYFTVKG